MVYVGFEERSVFGGGGGLVGRRGSKGWFLFCGFISGIGVWGPVIGNNKMY